MDMENEDHYRDALFNDHVVVGPDNYPETSSSIQDEVGFAEPNLGMEFKSEDAAKTFYDEYARRVGFGTRVSQFRFCDPDGQTNALEFLCAREGIKRKNSESCNAMLRIERKYPDIWVVSKFVKEHSHSTATPSKVHHLRPRTPFPGGTKAKEQTYSEEFGQPFHIPRDRNPKSIERNRVNSRAKTLVPRSYEKRTHKAKTLGNAQNLLDYFKKMQAEHPGFYYAVQLNGGGCMTNVFWADARSRTAYKHFGDTVTFDATFVNNNYEVPLASFTGVNHHGQIVLFGCGLVVDESESSFIWLFRTWLAAMNDQSPLSITTDSDKVVRSAVSKVFPRTRHRICQRRFLREGQRRFDRLYHNHPTFQGDLYNCINMSETIEEFESLWSILIDKHHLMKNDWLQGLYDTRQLWVPVYFRGTFFASISGDQGSEAACSFFDGYVDQETTLPVFFRQYERALERNFEKEIEADLETMRTTPLLKTPSPMEKQAANLYTRRIFLKFQEELVETFAYTANKEYDDGSFSTYRVAKFEVQEKAYMVSLQIPEMRATCSCQFFEYSGILCRHVLTVFTVTNVFNLPSHYIKKRWTRHAKGGPASDYRGIEAESLDSFTSRYNSLCQEALRYAEEGAVAVETYNSAINAIREGAKKVVVAMKDAARVAPKSQVLGSQEDGNKDIPVAKSDMTSLLWPHQVKPQLPFYCPDMTHLPWMSHQDGAAHHSVHKNVGAHTPPSGKNIPRLAPLSLQQDDGPSDAMVLPCLRSMTWSMENKDLMPAKRVAVIYFKLQDYSKGSPSDTEVKFQLSKVTVEPMLRSMASIGEQLAPLGNQVAVMNLKLQDSGAISGETEVKFQVSRDTLGAILRSMAYIREQLFSTAEPLLQPSVKRLRQ